MRVLIFGGAFNPPTLAHEAIISACVALPDFDELWLMPSGDRFDKHIANSDTDRLGMLRAVHHHTFDGHPRLAVSDFELRLPQPSATYKTKTALESMYSDTQFTFIFGRDAYVAMPSWPHGQELQTTLQMLIITSGVGPDIAAPNVRLLAIANRFQNASSTYVRQRAAEGKPFDHLVSKSVRDYIAEHALYQ